MTSLSIRNSVFSHKYKVSRQKDATRLYIVVFPSVPKNKKVYENSLNKKPPLK